MAKVITVIEFLTRAALFIRKNGHVNRPDAEQQGTACTADDAYFSLSDGESIEEQEEDANMAQSAHEWALNLNDGSPLFNVACLERVDFGSIDLLASLIPAYLRTVKVDEVLGGASLQDSGHFGNEGERINPPGQYGGARQALGPVTIIDNFQYRGRGGVPKGCVKFLTEDGDVLTWWTTPRTSQFVIGDRVMLVNALIKGHTEYEGVKQTRIGCPAGHRNMVRKLTR